MRITISLLRTEDRLQSDRARVEEMLFTLEDSAQIFGLLDDPASDHFSMARLDRIKTSLVWRNALARARHCKKIAT